MEIIIAQCITIAIFFMSMLISCLLPLKIVPTSGNYELGITLANSVSAGVFLATFFIGLLPEVRQQFVILMHHYQIITRLPVTDFIVCCGFVLALFAEQALVMYKNKARRELQEENIQILPLNEESFRNSINEEIQPSFNDSKSGGHIEHSHSHDVSNAFTGTGIRLGLLLASLGVHSIFEGMTLGLQTKIRELFNLFIGVLIHECLIAFAIGVNMANAKLKFLTAFKLAILISSTIPVGQIVGFLIGNNQSVYNGALSIVLQALAAGTFIQVTFMEIIPEGLSGEKFKLLKLLFLVLGFAIIALIVAFTNAHDVKQDKIQDDFNYLLKMKYESVHL